MPTGITMAKTNFTSVDEYIASQPEAAKGALKRVRSTIRKAVPGATEVISLRGPQGHDPLSALRARSRDVDRRHREVPCERSRRARESEGGGAEEALQILGMPHQPQEQSLCSGSGAGGPSMQGIALRKLVDVGAPIRVGGPLNPALREPPPQSPERYVRRPQMSSSTRRR
jgi:hypothetical protein